ncbi:MAG TPA: sugar transferase [Gemmatimonadota bacterium]|nr:sugar transferase [Gemmatimonadota bacterium]
MTHSPPMESERRGRLARLARELVVEPGGAAGRSGSGAEAGFRGPARVFGAAGAAGAWVARGPTALRRAVAGLDAAFKRAVDIALAGGMLLFSLPLALLAAAAIKLEDGGRVFYGQERVGRRGRRFRSWKFRSMKPRERTDGPLKQAGLEEHRITRVGRLMRACAFDEMPQLWNICRGDMSFVGPRALLPAEVEAAGNGEPVRLEEVPGYEERHLVRPGLTGLAQVYAARDVPHRWKFRYDLLYVRTRTPWLDLSLILRSMWISVRGAWPEVGKGAG